MKNEGSFWGEANVPKPAFRDGYARLSLPEKVIESDKVGECLVCKVYLNKAVF